MIGHVPIGGVCLACGRPAPSNEPCPEQEKALGLLREGYIALPASAEHLAEIVKEATDR